MGNNCFSRRLHGLFVASAFSHEGLARNLGVTVQTVRQWESGEKVPDINQFRYIADMTGMPYDWFLDEDKINVTELAAYLGLSEDTVEELAALSENGYEEILNSLDDLIYMVINAIKMALEADRDA